MQVLRWWPWRAALPGRVEGGREGHPSGRVSGPRPPYRGAQRRPWKAALPGSVKGVPRGPRYGCSEDDAQKKGPVRGCEKGLVVFRHRSQDGTLSVVSAGIAGIARTARRSGIRTAGPAAKPRRLNALAANQTTVPIGAAWSEGAPRRRIRAVHRRRLHTSRSISGRSVGGRTGVRRSSVGRRCAIAAGWRRRIT